MTQILCNWRGWRVSAGDNDTFRQVVQGCFDLVQKNPFEFVQKIPLNTLASQRGWGTRIPPRVSFAVLVMCGARTPRDSCVCSDNVWFSAEAPKVSHVRSVKTPSPRKWNLIVKQTLCEDSWWDTCYTRKSPQTRTEEAAHQAKGKK